MLAVCDHFEPFHDADKQEALRRVARWREGFPKIADAFRDADGEPPRHTFFYPVEQYDADVVGGIAGICHATHCETEVHLHHDNDTPENRRATLEEGRIRCRGGGRNDLLRFRRKWPPDHRDFRGLSGCP